ncbi:protein derived from transposon [Anaeramoeba ignava]|uniref:Protein derived from transposon n=1 Tax=Anaeramoeba ignava TaxID=1746090 RepID=A0A9Q0LTR5_ANAIG|nr:protein derived from transposon [Anaeramoeba ignava]
MARCKKNSNKNPKKTPKVKSKRRNYVDIPWKKIFEKVEEKKRGSITYYAKKYNISRSALSTRYWRWKREKPMNENTKDGRVEANIKNKRILKEDDENQLLELIRDDISAGESITPKQIGKLAKSLFFSSRKKSINSSWIYRFMKRNNLTLRQACIHEIFPDDFDGKKEVEEFLEMTKDLEARYSHSQVFNMDETHIVFEPEIKKTVSEKGKKQAQIKSKGNPKEGCTVVGCIGADGKHLPLTFILKGGSRVIKWIKQDISNTNLKGNCTFFANSKSWMTRTVLMKWFKEVFLPNTPTPCALFLDHFKVHEDKTFIDFAFKNQVEVFFIPPHLTGQLQPLDKMIFRQFKFKYQDELEEEILSEDSLRIKRLKVTKACFSAWNKIEAHLFARAFRKTGIIHDNLDSFDEKSVMDFIETHSVKKIEATEKENLNKEKIEEKNESVPTKLNLEMEIVNSDEIPQTHFEEVPIKESFDCKKTNNSKNQRSKKILLKRKIIRSILKRKLTLTQIPPKIGFEKDSSIEITQNKFGYEENTEPNGEDNQELFPLIKKTYEQLLSFPITKKTSMGRDCFG